MTKTIRRAVGEMLGMARPVPVSANTRDLSEIDAELHELTASEREAHARQRRLEELQLERDQVVAAAAEAERLKRIEAMKPEWERSRAAYASKISQVEEAMQALMVEFYEALKHGIEANRWKTRIEREGEKVAQLRGFQSTFLSYFNYPKLVELHLAAGLGNMVSGAARAIAETRLQERDSAPEL